MASVAIVVSDDSPAHRETAEAVRAELVRASGAVATVTVLPVSALASQPAGSMQAAVAVGTQAARALALRDPRLPVLGTLIPRTSYERILAESGHSRDSGRFSAVFIEQPLERQFELVRQALPGTPRVGLLLGPESAPQLDTVRGAATARKLRLNVQRVVDAQDIYPALQRLLGETDVLLALPDPTVFNSGTVPHILLTTYRQRIPLVGFSAAYVRAGAVLALYSTPEQIGRQAAEMLRSGLAAGHLPPPQYPRQFVVGINPHVARSLEIVIDDAETLQRKVLAAEPR